MMKLMEAINDLDHIGDLIEVNMVKLGQRRIEKGFKISEATQKVINTLHMVVSDALKAAVRAVVEDEHDLAYGNVRSGTIKSPQKERHNRHN